MITGTIEGIEGRLVAVDEIAVSEVSQRELRVRVRSALIQSDLQNAITRIGVQLGSMRAVGVFDLPVAMQAAGLDFDGVVLGELSLAGEIRTVRGVLPVLLAAKAAGIEQALVPRDNVEEAAASGLTIYTARRLRDVADGAIRKLEAAAPPPPVQRFVEMPPAIQSKFDEVMGLIENGHNVLLLGPFGSGKTMIARRVPAAMPAPDEDELLFLAKVRSATGLTPSMLGHRPFRAPHHTVGQLAMVGRDRPGEMTLAHGGILFLDDVHLFASNVLRAIASASDLGRVNRMPTRPTIVAAAPPCTCSVPGGRCRCLESTLDAHRERIDFIADLLKLAVVET